MEIENYEEINNNFCEEKQHPEEINQESYLDRDDINENSEENNKNNIQSYKKGNYL